jgi:short-subunit dehydrogenase
MATYFASKAFVLSFSVALNDECRGTGVTVTAVCPGGTKTEFHKRAGIDNPAMFEDHAMSARDVAVIGYRGTMKGKAVVVTGFKNKVMALSGTLAPRTLAARVAGKMNRAR